MSVFKDIETRQAAALGLFSGSSVAKTGLPNLTTYDDEQEDPEMIVLKYNDVKLRFASLLFGANSGIYAPAPLIRFGRQKRLIETSVNGSSHQVVENWSNDAYDIQLRGILVDMKSHRFPEAQIKELHKLFSYNGVIEVSGRQFLAKDITAIYIRNHDVNVVEGFEDTQQYVINARSTKPVTFTLKNPV